VQDFKSIPKDRPKTLGLYHYFCKGSTLDDIIRKTELPTLDIIPETIDLNLLERDLRNKQRREYTFSDDLIPFLKEKYDVIIFDNSPNFNMLIENALTSSSTIVTPLGCDLGTYESLDTNLYTIETFRDLMRLKWETVIFIPTLLENNKLSTQLHAYYVGQFPNLTRHSIRRTTKAQEAQLLKKSIFEYDPTSPLADDYYNVLREVWNEKILKTNTHRQ
jgi:chromosome partitioning protein